MSARYLTGKPLNSCCHGVVDALKRLAIRIVKDDGRDALHYAQQVDELAGQVERGELAREEA